MKNSGNSKRHSNSTLNGKSFSQKTVDSVWEKAKVLDFFHPDFLRADCCGALILKEDYGDSTSPFGWEIDHLVPVSKGGNDKIENLQPLQWENNKAKADNYPKWTGVVNSFTRRRRKKENV